MKIKAAVTRCAHCDFEIDEVTLDDPRPDEVLVKVAAVGICHTDLVVRDQVHPVPLPLVLGHEGSGVVIKTGERVKKVQPGDHVVMTGWTCGTCSNCVTGQPSYCLNSFKANWGGCRLDGTTPLSKDGQTLHTFFTQSSFATHAVATERNVVKVPKDVPLELMGPLGCGVQVGAGAVFNSLRPLAGSSLVVFGAGAVGLSAVMAAALSGCTPIIVVDVKPMRLELAKTLGATHIINGLESGDVVQDIQNLTDGGALFSVEATGLPKLLRSAVDCLRRSGVCAMLGAPPTGTDISFDGTTMLLGRSLRGLIGGGLPGDVFIPRLIQLYREGRFPFDKMVRFYRFDEINQAAADAERGDTIKPVLKL